MSRDTSFQARSIIRRRLHLGVEQRAVGVGGAAELGRGGDKALHQVALGRADIGFVDIDATLAQQLLDVHQLPVLQAIQAKDRTMMKVEQFQGTQLDPALAAQQGFGALAMGDGNEGDGGLRR